MVERNLRRGNIYRKKEINLSIKFKEYYFME
jgi:hypothetical protein